jgi:hypothetical protein
MAPAVDTVREADSTASAGRASPLEGMIARADRRWATLAAMADSNPYAPPGAPAAPNVESAATSGSDYQPERRAVILCIALTFVTLGFYPAIWLLRRRPFLDRLDASKRLSPALPWVCIAVNALSFVVSFTGKDGAQVGNLLSVVAAVPFVIASFRVASILSSDFRRTGRLLSVSYGATFFFSIYYLQYKMNRAASIPARLPKDREA